MQSTSSVFLVRPAAFGFNNETAASNHFQKQAAKSDHNAAAQKEFDTFASTLRDEGLNVTIFEDSPAPPKPDAIFPNNWISLHHDGTIVLYPMQALNRRTERRQDIIDSLKRRFKVSRIIDLTHYEQQNRFLEGTGSIVFDHDYMIAYACISPRTDKELFIDLCAQLGYKPICFHATDIHGNAIYHTNVVMSVCYKFTIICLDSIADAAERKMVEDSLNACGHMMVDITEDQLNNFAGNMLALQTRESSMLLLSQTAFKSLTPIQKQTLDIYTKLVPVSIPTIESIGGGSARCMIAEIFLPPIVQ